MIGVLVGLALYLGGPGWEVPVEAIAPAPVVVEEEAPAPEPPTTAAPRPRPTTAATLPRRPTTTPCSEWAELAQRVGWPADRLPTLLRIMKCESECSPRAHNRSGATGLLQVMPMWAKGRDLYDPATNLAVGLEVYRAQGWKAWSCY